MLMKEKVCVIVGTASPKGIGRAAVELFREQAATVVAVDIAMDDPRAGIRCDVVDAEDCERMFSEVIARHGRLDCLVNCAGTVSPKGMLDIGMQDFDRILETNLKGAFNLCQGALRRFREQRSGVIVNVSSLAAQRGGGLLGGPHYAAAKGGVISLTRAIAREFGPLGIRANVVCPAMIGTGMLDGFSRERLDEIVSGIPLGRAGLAREAAGACLFLASDLAGYVTGATLDVNGGSHIH
jgi:NAD(P)-dependent dehydrogenase (short-subunit alcohol dehydrogenase family)